LNLVIETFGGGIESAKILNYQGIGIVRLRHDQVELGQMLAQRIGQHGALWKPATPAHGASAADFCRPSSPVAAHRQTSRLSSRAPWAQRPPRRPDTPATPQETQGLGRVARRSRLCVTTLPVT